MSLIYSQISQEYNKIALQLRRSRYFYRSDKKKIKIWNLSLSKKSKMSFLSVLYVFKHRTSGLFFFLFLLLVFSSFGDILSALYTAACSDIHVRLWNRPNLMQFQQLNQISLLIYNMYLSVEHRFRIIFMFISILKYNSCYRLVSHSRTILEKLQNFKCLWFH